MDEKSFNLLHEKWILALKHDGDIAEVSLLDVFRKAPEFRSLAGELPTQDVAVLRLLLAILHATFSRYDYNGNWAPLLSPNDALRRWKVLWDAGTFPMEIIEDYLMHYEERFYLFHPEYPFYQVPELSKATDYTSAKLNGELSESTNKIRLFPQRSGNSRSALSDSEAARWLLHTNSFDDTSSKPQAKGLPSPGAGWLGKLGIIHAVGTSLFETLLLNLVLLKDGGDELWGEEKPIWEVKKAKSEERTEITMPDNPSELLTLQSRRLLLRRKGQPVVGYSLLGGDFFPKENAFNEQMTLWRSVAQKNSDPPEYYPRRHDPNRQLWRDFSVLAGLGGSGRCPGMVGWLTRLGVENLIPRSHVRFQTVSAEYGDKDFFIDDVFADSLSFSAGLLSSLGPDWANRIIDEVDTTEKLAEQLGWLAQNLAIAAGSSDGTAERNAAKQQAYFRLDEPFRRWLEGIDPSSDSMNEVCDRWWEESKRIVRGLGRELVSQSGARAFVGRYVAEKTNQGSTEHHYSAPEAYQYFLQRTSRREALRAPKKGGATNG